jgi:ubiquilin
MTEINIKVKFTKSGQTTVKEFQLVSDMLVEELRLIIEEELKVPSYKQNLIFKGKMLQNEKKLEDYKISNNDLILLVEKIGETGEKAGLNKVSGQSGIGTPGQINYDLLKQPMGYHGDLTQLIEAMKIPEIAGQMDSIFDDPNIMDAMMQNPQIKAMIAMNPGIKDLLTNKEFMKNMLQPENLERLKRFQDGTATLQDVAGGLGLNMNNNMNNNNWANTGNPFGMYGMPMGNPFMMNPLLNLYGGGFGNNFNNNNNNNFNNLNMTQEQLKEKYKDQISKIKDMGFGNEEEIINALKKTNGNIDAAIERMINGLK